MSALDPSIAKVCIVAGLFLGSLVFAAIPVLISRRTKSYTHLLSGLSCLGGGVFLATCFLHLIPEAVEAMEDALKSSHLSAGEFPVAYAIIVAGFMLVLISDQLVQKLNKGQVQLGHSHAPSQSHDDSEPGEVVDDDDRMTMISTHGDPGSHKPFRAIVFVFALSLHSFFEGLAIGLQEKTQDVVQLFGAIAVHKSVIAVSLATSLVSSTRLKTWGLLSAIIVFAAMSPLGILSGLPLEDAPPLVVGALQCIAAGTFVYVTFFEILPHELNSKSTEGSKLFKTSMVLLGIGLMVVVMLAFPE